MLLLLPVIPASARPELADADVPLSLDARLQELKQAALDAAVEADIQSETAPLPVSEGTTAAPPAVRTRLTDWVDRTLPDAFARNVRDVVGVAPDPRWQHARKLLEQGQPFSAARELRVLGMRLGFNTGSAAAPADWSALLARCLIAYGTPESAQTLLAGLPPPAGLDEDRAQARITLAAFQFRHGGQPGAALATLDALPKRLDAANDYEARLLRSLILLDLHRDAEAAKVLAKIQPDPQKLLTAPPEQVRDALVPQYDLGIALLRSGEASRGRSLLDRIGRIETRDRHVEALRDKANLALGWQFLREAQGATAAPIFERIALEGPYSNRALLGLGWAALAPQGKGQGRDDIAVGPDTRETPKFVLKLLQRRKLINCEEFNQLSRAPQDLCDRAPRFEQGATTKNPSRVAERALAPWLELQARDSSDPAVRESWTALPHALAKLGARSEAERWYQAAVMRLEAELKATEQHLRAVHSRDIALPASSGDKPREPATNVSAKPLFEFLQASELEALPESPELIEALSTLHDLRWLQTQIDSGLAADSSLAKALLSLRQDTAQQIKDLAIQHLEATHKDLGLYLKAARFGLAALYDPAFSGPPIERK